jgi:hypothetical protein
MFSPSSSIAWVGFGDGKDAADFMLAVASFGQNVRHSDLASIHVLAPFPDRVGRYR